VDTDRMAQVLNNLVANALRFTREGSVTLSARTSPSDHPDADVSAASVVLEVADTGSGIAAEDLPFVFERFYRADPSRTRSENDSTGAGESSGLGLAIARAIVEAHGGAIRVSSAPGAGSTFTVTLPVAPAPSGA
jgi:two-component system sensor histidine kinase BaeS